MASLSTLETGLRILSLFRLDHQTLSVREIATRAGLLESTAYRYVATLKLQGLLEETTRHGYYQLGLGLLSWYSVLRSRLGIVDLALPFMESLRNETGETTVLAAVHGMKGICLEKVESPHALRVSYERGAAFYLHAGSTGKVLLAHLPKEEQESIIGTIGLPRLTDRTTTDATELRKQLDAIRTTGYWISDGEQLNDVRGISAPILGKGGSIVACISIEGPIRRLEGQPSELAGKSVREIAQEISAIAEAV